MPGTNGPSRGFLMQEIADLRRSITALQTAQQQVVTDPTGATGDATHGHATYVSGYLPPITGLTGYGAAVWNGSAWVRVGPTLAAGPMGAITTASATPVALTGGPSITAPVPGNYLVRWGAFLQMQAAPALFQANVKVSKNGSTVSSALASVVGQATFDAASVLAEQTLTLLAGDVLTLVVSSNGLSCSYSAATLSVSPV